MNRKTAGMIMATIIVGVAGCGILFQGWNARQKLVGKTQERMVEYWAMNQKEKRKFPSVIREGEEEYQKVKTRYQVVEEKKEFLEVQSEERKKFLRKDGILYTLQSSKQLSEPGTEQMVAAYTDYHKPVKREDVPQIKEVKVFHEEKSQEEIVECSLKEIKQQGNLWIQDQIDITFQSYDSGYFQWRDREIVEQDNQFPLIGHEKEVLESVGLKEEMAKVKKMAWKGEAYVKGGILCRDATAEIERCISVYRACYEGVLKSETVPKWKLSYQAVSGSKLYKIQAKAVYEPVLDSSFVPVGMGVLLFALILGIVSTIYVIRIKLSEKRSIQTCQTET